MARWQLQELVIALVAQALWEQTLKKGEKWY